MAHKDSRLNDDLCSDWYSDSQHKEFLAVLQKGDLVEFKRPKTKKNAEYSHWAVYIGPLTGEFDMDPIPMVVERCKDPSSKAKIAGQSLCGIGAVSSSVGVSLIAGGKVTNTAPGSTGKVMMAAGAVSATGGVSSVAVGTFQKSEAHEMATHPIRMASLEDVWNQATGTQARINNSYDKVVTPPYTNVEVCQRAIKAKYKDDQIGSTPYNAMTANCEHFAKEIRNGKGHCGQTIEVTWNSIQHISERVEENIQEGVENPQEMLIQGMENTSIATSGRQPS